MLFFRLLFFSVLFFCLFVFGKFPIDLIYLVLSSFLLPGVSFLQLVLGPLQIILVPSFI